MKTSKKWHILSTRHILLSPDNQKQLRQHHIHLHTLDFIKIEFNPTPRTLHILNEMVSARRPALIIVSQNSVRAMQAMLSEKLPHLNADIYCIGRKTYALARKTIPHSTAVYLGENADSAVKELVKYAASSSFFLMQSNVSLPTLSHALHQYGIPFTPCTLYRTILCPKKINQSYDTILFYSPSGVCSFFEANPNYASSLPYFCIGAATAQAVHHFVPTAPICQPSVSLKSQLLQTLINYLAHEFTA